MHLGISEGWIELKGCFEVFDGIGPVGASTIKIAACTM
jgi:hypothetical protein